MSSRNDQGWRPGRKKKQGVLVKAKGSLKPCVGKQKVGGGGRVWRGLIGTTYPSKDTGRLWKKPRAD